MVRGKRPRSRVAGGRERRSGGELVLPLHHRVNPDGDVGDDAAFGGGPVFVEADFFADGDGAFAEARVFDADGGEGVVHGPLDLWICFREFFFDAGEESFEVDGVGVFVCGESAFVDAAGGEVPAGAGGPGVFVGVGGLHPLFAEGFFGFVLRDDVGVEPVGDVGEGGGAGELVDVGGGERLGIEKERSEELGIDVVGVPEFEGEGVFFVGLSLNVFGEGADVAVLDAELIGGRAELGVVFAAGFVAFLFERGEELFESGSAGGGGVGGGHGGQFTKDGFAVLQLNRGEKSLATRPKCNAGLRMREG